MPLYVDTIPTPLSLATAAIDDDGALVHFAFTRSVDEVVADVARAGEIAHRTPGRALHVADAVHGWFAGAATTFDLPLAPRGTEFQRAVWDALCAIPFGEVRTYGQLAADLGRPGGARAVGQANGRNPIALIVPCHRVVATAGLGGYTGGLAIKRALLAHEGALRPEWADPQLPLLGDGAVT